MTFADARERTFNPQSQGASARDVSCCPTLCSSCKLFQLCAPCPLAGLDLDGADELISTHKRVRRGESLYRAGDAFGSLYALHTGFLKSSVVLAHGKEQITGFHMAGEMIGLDGIGTERYTLDTVALENSDVYVMPFACIEKAVTKAPLLQRQFHRMMSREMERGQGVMMLLGTRRADARVAVFLLNLSTRFAARGYSALEFDLRMSRDDIGSYLGLTLETVSRAFSRFQHNRLLAVDRRHVRILDIDGLKHVMRRES